MKPGRDGKTIEAILGYLETKLLAYVDGWRRELGTYKTLEGAIDREGPIPPTFGRENRRI